MALKKKVSLMKMALLITLSLILLTPFHVYAEPAEVLIEGSVDGMEDGKVHVLTGQTVKINLDWIYEHYYYMMQDFTMYGDPQIELVSSEYDGPKDIFVIEDGSLIRGTIPESLSHAGQYFYIKFNYSNGRQYVTYEPFLIYGNIAEAGVSGISDTNYTGENITQPSMKVTADGNPLSEGIDYIVSYENNINAGTATITITGKGIYAGTKKVSFKIIKAEEDNSKNPGDPANSANSVESVVTTTGTYSVQNNEATFTAPAKKTAKTVTVPATIKANGKTVKVTAIAPNALKGMKKLTKVTIGSNVTTIGKNAFANDAKLTTVTIGKNVKSIGARAFYKCKALKKITIKTKKLTKKTIGSKAFTGINKKAVIKSPKAKKAAYKKILLKKGMKKTTTFK